MQPLFFLGVLHTKILNSQTSIIIHFLFSLFLVASVEIFIFKILEFRLPQREIKIIDKRNSTPFTGRNQLFKSNVNKKIGG